MFAMPFNKDISFLLVFLLCVTCSSQPYVYIPPMYNLLTLSQTSRGFYVSVIEVF